MKRAAIYLRVSTDGQSCDSQRAETEAVAARKGFTDVEVFEDTASGAKFTRKGLDALMTGVRKGRFGAVICYKLDRLGRSLPHLAQLIAELDSHGAALIAHGQGIDTSDANPAARLQMHVLLAVAEFERSIISERVRAGMAAARKKGRLPGRPKGSKSIPSRRRLKAEELLRADPGMTCQRLAGEARVAVGTAWKWKKEILAERMSDG